MSKVAAIFENPTCCNECLCITNGLESSYCDLTPVAKKHIEDPFHTKPDWCPLKEVKDGDEY